ncbi:MAG: hypothetical protein ABJN40_16065 [Sneathiella sp.]
MRKSSWVCLFSFGMLIIGAALYFYIQNLPASGQAMDGILSGLLALLGLIMTGAGLLGLIFFLGYLFIRKIRKPRA